MPAVALPQRFRQRPPTSITTNPAEESDRSVIPTRRQNPETMPQRAGSISFSDRQDRTTSLWVLIRSFGFSSNAAAAGTGAGYWDGRQCESCGPGAGRVLSQVIWHLSHPQLVSVGAASRRNCRRRGGGARSSHWSCRAGRVVSLNLAWQPVTCAAEDRGLAISTTGARMGSAAPAARRSDSSFDLMFVDETSTPARSGGSDR